MEKTLIKSKLSGEFSFKENSFPFRKGNWGARGTDVSGERLAIMEKPIDYRMKVLVVDDFTTMRKIVRNILKEIGFENIMEADDGTTALHLLKNEKVGLVVTDWNMPHMTGLELLKQIRQNPQTAKIPVLMVTAEGLKENVLEAVKAGVNNYVVKPFSAEVLQEKIKTIFK